jgi:hypothetical protein
LGGLGEDRKRSGFMPSELLKRSHRFYVALEDNEGKTSNVSEEIISTWSQHWVTVNNKFEAMLSADPIL